jgi:hypothetical protein
VLAGHGLPAPLRPACPRGVGGPGVGGHAEGRGGAGGGNASTMAPGVRAADLRVPRHDWRRQAGGEAWLAGLRRATATSRTSGARPRWWRSGAFSARPGRSSPLSRARRRAALRSLVECPPSTTQLVRVCAPRRHRAVWVVCGWGLR